MNDHPQPPEGPRGEFHYKAHRVSYHPEQGGLVLRIDDTPLPPLSRRDDGQYSTGFFPFRGFQSVEEVARALIDTEGTLWSLH